MQAAVGRHLKVEGLNFAFVTQDAAGLAEGLKSRAPVGIVYATPKDPEVVAVDVRIGAEVLPVDASKLEIRPASGFMER